MSMSPAEMSAFLRYAEAQEQRQAAEARKRDRRHVAVTTFSDPGETASSFTFQPQDTVITVGKDFWCTRLEAFSRFVGSNDDILSSTQFNCVLAQEPFNLWIYRWKVADTNRNREWCVGWQPSAFLETSMLRSQSLPAAQFIPAGTEIRVSIEPTRAIRTTTLVDDSVITVSTYQVEFSLVGYESV